MSTRVDDLLEAAAATTLGKPPAAESAIAEPSVQSMAAADEPPSSALDEPRVEPPLAAAPAPVPTPPAAALAPAAPAAVLAPTPPAAAPAEPEWAAESVEKLAPVASAAAQGVRRAPTPPPPPRPPIGATAAANDASLESVEAAAEDKGEGKTRSLEQMMSLKPGDDARTEVSKKISWILRHGARKVNVDIDGDGWVPLKSLISSEILFGIGEDRLLDVINESNQQKMRYEIKEEGGRSFIRAVSKSRRREAKDTTRRERRPRDEDDRGGDRSVGDQELRELDGDRRQDAPHRRGKGDDQAQRWWGGGPTAKEEIERLSFEEQLALGFRPVFLGENIIAMTRDDETVRPGRRSETENHRAERDRDQHRDHENRDRGDRERGDPYWKDRGRGLKANDGKGKGKNHDMDEVDGKGDGKSLKSRGKDSKGFAKKGKDGKSHLYDAEDDHFYEGGKGERYGKSSKEGKPFDRGREMVNYPERLPRYWRVARSEGALVRSGEDVESDQIGQLKQGTLVMQLGDDKTMKNRIVRMQIELLEAEGHDGLQAGFRGWVTRTAEAAGGPVFFKPDRGAGLDRGCAEKGGTRERGDKGCGKIGAGRDKGGKGSKNRRPYYDEGKP